MHEPMSPQREAIVRREMADTTYGSTWHIRENAVDGVDVWEVTHEGTVLATLPDWGGSLAMWIADARDDVPQLLALVTQLREQLAKVADFAAKRAEYVTNLRHCSPTNNRDYYRWQGHAEARRQLSQLLGLPVGWPAEDQVEAVAADGR